MATATFNTAPHNTDATAFRAWGKAISDALTAVGMVKTADSGQINWATVAAPSTTNQKMGYEIWRFDDALQATYPLFVRIDYGSSATVTPRLWVTIGKGSDGAGNLTGVIMAEQVVGYSSTSAVGSSTTLSPGYVSTCPGKACLTVMPFAGSPANRSVPAFVIDRSRDMDGAATGDGVLFACILNAAQLGTSGPGTLFVAINYASGQSNSGVVPVIVPYTIAGATIAGASTLSSGIIAPVFPWVAFAPGLAPWQSLAAMSFLEGDAIAGDVTIHAFGADHTYKVIPAAAHYGWGVAVNPNGGTTSVTSNRVGVVILWED